MIKRVFTRRFRLSGALYTLALLLLAQGWWACSPSEGEINFSIIEALEAQEGIRGKEAYLKSPFFAAGDRLYMVGHQDGTFPDMGFHVPGEMGGIWNHPIKLMDGFTMTAMADNGEYCLNDADEFVNYPIGNKHVFRNQVPNFEITRAQFVPDGVEGMVVEYRMTNVSPEKRPILMEFTGYTDLRPVWLGEETGMLDAEDDLTFHRDLQGWMGKDSQNPWYVIFGGDQRLAMYREGRATFCIYKPNGLGKASKLSYNFEIEPGQSADMRIFIAGSYTDQETMEATYEDLKRNYAKYFQDKAARYAEIAAQANLTTPDSVFNQAFRWVKYNTEWLVREVPEFGRGLGAGMPDYPWWFGVDNEYTLKGAIATGRKDITLHTIDLIRKFSEQGTEDGRIIHEVSTNGVVFNPGNVNETPQFSSLIRWVYDWTGEQDLLTQNYPIMRSGLNWLLDKKDSDGNLFPDGYGMMEIHGLNSEMIDVAVYTQRGLEDAAYVAGVLGEQQDQRRFERLAKELKEKINEEFWVEEMGAYADFIGTPEEALLLLEDALIRADTLEKPWAVAELQEARERIRKYPKGVKRGFVLYHNWVVNTPMEMGIAPQEKGIRALDKGAKFTNPFGVFVTGIDRDERADEEDGSFSGSQVFSYVGAVMTLPTGVQAVAENNYGRPNQALDYLQRMTRSFSFALPGSIYEVSPDYGMMTQAWNLYSYAVPVITQFLGIRPKAAERHVELMPHLPDAWQPGVSIERLPMGDNELTVKYKWKDGRKIAQVEHSQKDWTTSFAFPAGKYKEILLNGTPQEILTEGEKSYIKTNKPDFILEILL